MDNNGETNFVQYIHHGRRVWVREDLKGRHQEFCLCYSCREFHPGEPVNCTIAQNNYEKCIAGDMVLPVWECPVFQETMDG